MTSRVALLALTVPLLAACRQCPAGGCAPKDVTIRVVGSPRTGWAGAVTPCLPGSWHARVRPVVAVGGADIAVPRKRYEPSRTTEVLACLRRVDGVTSASVLGDL